MTMQINIFPSPQSKCWLAVFAGGDMPQGVPLPLPYHQSAPWRDVAFAMLDRFPGAFVRAPEGSMRQVAMTQAQVHAACVAAVAKALGD